ncbi:hypothetical protein ACJJTC_015613 [Scirpophaga incertulas]
MIIKYWRVTTGHCIENNIFIRLTNLTREYIVRMRSEKTATCSFCQKQVKVQCLGLPLSGGAANDRGIGGGAYRVRWRSRIVAQHVAALRGVRAQGQTAHRSIRTGAWAAGRTACATSPGYCSRKTSNYLLPHSGKVPPHLLHQ